MSNRTFQVTVRHKLFHSDLTPSLGTIRVTVNEKGAVRFSQPKLTEDIEQISTDCIKVHRDVMRKHVKDYMEDPRYPIIWNEESGWESEIKELTQ